MSMLGVHSELFLLNKTLISVVFTYAIKEIYARLLKLFTNVPSFCQNSAIQTYVDIFCLRETFKVYTSEDSKELIQKILKLVPSASFEDNKKLMTTLISDFQKTMLPYISVMQQAPPSSAISVAFVWSNNLMRLQTSFCQSAYCIQKISFLIAIVKHLLFWILVWDFFVYKLEILNLVLSTNSEIKFPAKKPISNLLQNDKLQFLEKGGLYYLGIAFYLNTIIRTFDYYLFNIKNFFNCEWNFMDFFRII